MLPVFIAWKLSVRNMADAECDCLFAGNRCVQVLSVANALLLQ